jgi:hypothetical protein
LDLLDIGPTEYWTYWILDLLDIGPTEYWTY